VLPLGISFFVFQKLSYLIDLRRGDRHAYSLLDFSLFVSFFPQLIAGPLVRHNEIIDQFAKDPRRPEMWENLSRGAVLFVIGMTKKLAIADTIAENADRLFDAATHATPNAAEAWAAAGAYALQIYFDFSGYTDMAIGLAWMVGLRFPDNFDQPYRATSVIAYWQQWHMSLTRFLMTHVHAPLTLAILRWRKRRGRGIDSQAQRMPGGFGVMIAMPIVVTMMLVALWHGATWPFLLFGLLHAGFLAVNHAWRVTGAPVLPKLASAALTYGCVLIGAVLFRATSVADAASVLAGMAGMHGGGIVQFDPHGIAHVAWLLALYLIVWFAPTTRQWMQPEPAVRLGWSASPRWAVAMGCAAALGVLAAGGTGEFLYFRF
jgi:D-alanyl-lipoteichoic acid acyltransferase DltB (MBOAT superfamily)